MRFIEFDETKRERAERGVSWVILERVGYRLALQPSSPHTPSNTFLLYLLISFNLITVLIFFLVLFTNNINSNEKQSLFVKWKSLIGMEQKRCGSVGVDCVGGYWPGRPLYRGRRHSGRASPSSFILFLAFIVFDSSN